LNCLGKLLAPAPGTEQYTGVEDPAFEAWMASELAALPGVIAVSLGGSRAQGTHRPDSDWDYAVYYRGAFDPGTLRAKGWAGQVSEVGGWGGGVMNGGAWLTIDGRRVDIHYRDLDEVEYWCAEATAGRFKKELLLFYAAGIPTYVVIAELATNRVLVGELPRPSYPGVLATSAGRRWHNDALASLGYASAALGNRGDVAVALANASRGLMEAAQSVLASQEHWVLNEKGIVTRAGLAKDIGLLLAATGPGELQAAIAAVTTDVQSLTPGDFSVELPD
jgi:predicted nucleotidyltransferase